MSCIVFPTTWIFAFVVFLMQFGYSQKISPSVTVRAGAINGVFIERDGRTLVVYGDPHEERKRADLVLFTHFRRDVVWAGRSLVERGSLAIVPAEEKPYFVKGDSIWSNYTKARFHDYSNQTSKIVTAPMLVDRFVVGGESIKWQDMELKVLATPGYTRGAVSYLADIDEKRFVFTGDLIFGDGKLFDLYSFQDSLRGIDGYHGYAARLGQLIKSLQLVADQKPDFLVPCRGPVIKDPASAIQKLITRIRSLYQSYLSITAQRWNHTDRMITLTKHVLGAPNAVDWMPFATVTDKTPSWYQHINNSNLVMAEDSSAFLIDCGSKQSFQELMKLKRSRRLKRLDGLFITHYHDDHTDLVNDIVREFGCPVYVTKELKDILENPGAYQMPCLTNNPIRNLTIMQESRKISWKDFKLTFFYFPGQTLYHDGLLVEKSNGQAIFFSGDSFTPAGIDDYCLQNRNFLHPEYGYLYCLDFLKKLPQNVLLSNQHLKPLFSFSSDQLDHMKTVLQNRNSILKELLPWDNINFGTDEQWMSLLPHGIKSEGGSTIEYTLKIFNHSDVKKTFQVEFKPPAGFQIDRKTISLVIEPHSEGLQKFNIKISKKALPGLSILTTNVKFDEWDLREWSETYIEL
jgi:glyoxylase-like metal-dependent hydrolase (beta-lactamase superfamily II)